ncbi:MAG: hypothetical protein RLZZ301_738 [Bacteroidota bacterium]|jgi:gliding motility-associated-like protein
MKYSHLLFSFFFLSAMLFAQTDSDWTHSYQKARVFIENKGQFDTYVDPEMGPIAYVIDFGSTRVFFGAKGITYSFLEAQQAPKAQRDSLRAIFATQVPVYKEKERVVGKFRFKSDVLSMQFKNCNEQLQLLAVQKLDAYFSYPEAAKCAGFQKLIYQNVYPQIDLEYTVHPSDGLKYAFIVRPGGDPSQIRMLYNRPVQLIEGHLEIPTAFGPLIDHVPYTFQGQQTNKITSNFALYGNEIGFQLGAYNLAQTLVIDPWMQSPNFATNWDVIWECERDGAGNAYALGGIMPMQILKYSPSGTLLWTYNTPYDTSNVWLGTFAVDNAGNSYVTAGSVAQIQKISPSGTLLVNNPNPGGILSSAEFWSIAFNCDESALVIGGTGGALLQLDAVVYEVNTSTLNISNQQFISNGPTTSIPPNVEEVRAICAAQNGRYYFMTMDTIGYLSDNFGACPSGSSNFFKGPHNAAWGYKLENFRYDNAGICALATDPSHVFMHRGNELQKRSLADGSIVSTNTIPGGQYSSVFLGGQSTGNSGIAIDDCGNIYVGSTTGVYKFGNGLVQLAFYPTNFVVYDLEINTNGELLACGGTGTSTSGTRSGVIRSLAIGACAPISLSCCDANICQPQSVCVNDAPFNLTAGSPGGSWSGPGVSANGVFTPATAGVGVQTVVYTLPCGADSIQITVSPCTGLQLCQEGNGQVTVSGGVAPYSWSYYVPASNTPITNQTECQNCGYTWFFGQCLNGFTPVTNCSSPAAYTSFATGSSVSLPPNQTQFQVIDNAGTVLTFTLGQLVPCAPNPCLGFAASVLSQQNPSCATSTDGSISIGVQNGTAPYTYSWSPISSNQAQLTTLGAGTYTVLVTDANACSSTLSSALTAPPVLVANTSSSDTPCGSNQGSVTVTASGGTAPYSYLWTPSGSNLQTMGNLGANTYSALVTDANGCTQTATAVVLSTNGPQLNESITASSCVSATGSISVQVSGGTAPYTLSWSPIGGNANPLVGLPANDTLTLSVSDANDCGTSETYIIPNLGDFNMNAWASSSSIIEGESTQLNATGALSYSWSPTINLACSTCSSTIASPTITTQYVVTGTSSTGCTDSDTLLIQVSVLCGDIYIPSILSPKAAASENQKLCVYGNCIVTMDLRIYNRWGQEVFTSTDPQQCWDGTFKGELLPPDVFAYKLVIQLQDNSIVVKSGNITLFY